MPEKNLNRHNFILRIVLLIGQNLNTFCFIMEKITFNKSKKPSVKLTHFLCELEICINEKQFKFSRYYTTYILCKKTV